ncbi:hypothetical protein ACFWB0_16825 [Rhodococcus sp. NPDC060086]
MAPPPVEGKAAERAAATGVSAWRRLNKDEAESGADAITASVWVAEQ